MARVFIGLGTNIEPQHNARRALIELVGAVHITAISTIYRTEPQGGPEQPAFFNAVVEVESDLPPCELKNDVLREIEHRLGRKRSKDKSAPRTIDLDILIHENTVLSAGDLTIPDPDIPDRAFLAIPLFELAPNLVLPDSGVSIKELAAKFACHTMEPLLEYTESLRQEILK